VPTESTEEPAPGHATVRGQRPGDRYVRIVRSADIPQSKRDYYLIAEPTVPETSLGRGILTIKRLLIGRPLQSAQAEHQRLGKIKALAVFSSDAVSSSAYATEESLRILVLAGAAAMSYVLPVGIAITILLAIVAFSYRQTVFAYPQGGGSYIVTKDNLGKMPSLLAGASLMTDYILTVAVSISSGVAAVTSAVTRLYPFRVELAVAAIAFITIANLRGIRESGTIFAIPTYAFIFGMIIMLVLGFMAWFGVGPTPHPVHYPIPPATSGLGIFLILRSFSSGCTALTGVEAISDGVPAFKKPEAKNAATTLIWMALVLGTIFLGLTFLAHHFHPVPNNNETIISQLTRTIVGRTPFYYFIQAATAGILLIAANTSFADFPRMCSFLARDKFLPHQFLFRGDRLAYSIGIGVLATAAGILVIVFKASVNALIPLYAVGVFTAFTMSQASMTYRHWKKEPPGRNRNTGIMINGTGALVTGITTIIIIATKFISGAWIVMIIIPVLITQFLAIRKHYDRVHDQLAVDPDRLRQRASSRPQEPVVVVPIDHLSQAAIRAIDYARGISTDVTVVHIADEPEDAKALRRAWNDYHFHLPLVIVESPYRELLGPLVNFIEQTHREKDNRTLTVVLPEFVPAHLYEIPLHNQTAWRLRTALWTHPGIILITIPYHLEH